jgi:hypothetical protein
LLGLKGDETSPDPETIARFEQAVKLFGQGEFDTAAVAFEEVRRSCGGQDGPSEFYLQAIEDLRSQPLPEDWDGVVNLTKK